MRRDFVYFFLGIVLAAVMMPAAVVAASFVRIQGPSGNVAQVDAARQLMVAESDPAAFFASSVNSNIGDGCEVLVSQPQTSALIVRQLRITVVTSSALDNTHFMGFWKSKNCTGTALLLYQPSHLGSYTETFEPGYPIAAGSGVSVRAFGANFTTHVELTGYTVPAAAVP